MPALHASPAAADHHQVLIVGAGAAGIATASSLIKRDPSLDITLIDPSAIHYYQPGWTMVGAGVFDAPSTARNTADLLPAGVRWIQSRVTGFAPEQRQVMLEDGRTLSYQQLVVCPGLTLDWGAIEGLEETLGRNGVTSNYRYDLAPYTWKLVQSLQQGRALFTQPPMPIKCAGAPQKALYLSCDHWLRAGRLGDLRAIARRSPRRDQAGLLQCRRRAVRRGRLCSGADELYRQVRGRPQLQPASGGSGRSGSARHLRAHLGRWQQRDAHRALRLPACGAATSGPGLHSPEPPRRCSRLGGCRPAQPAASPVRRHPCTGRRHQHQQCHARKQAPVVANNVLVALGRLSKLAAYDGYGSCPLTVERGKIVLAEFTYGGKLEPSFPRWLLDGRNGWLGCSRLGYCRRCTGRPCSRATSGWRGHNPW